ncbi:MAG TPA: SPFH domain-containing protein [Rhodothermales bacterium]|nr:SPFH domain-containing protein [Rhodothermales bacterium]
MIRHFKGEPSTHVIKYKSGQIAEQGEGLSFFYTPFNTTVVAIPTTTRDAAFIFNETTADYQDVAVQGQCTYRLVDPERVAVLLDYSIDPRTQRYKTDDPEKLEGRILNALQTQSRGWIRARPLEEVLAGAEPLSGIMLNQVRSDAALQELGVRVESLYLTSITASPETKKALEAEYRESLLRRADQAIYDRRAATVAEERKIRQSELSTEIELEQNRQRLVELQTQNNLTEAEADAKAEAMKLEPYTNIPAAVLLSLAAQEWAKRGGSIDALTLTPDLLTQMASLISQKDS